jgi:hypothetical protein
MENILVSFDFIVKLTWSICGTKSSIPEMTNSEAPEARWGGLHTSFTAER